jgi:hypothetical protein
MEWISKELDEKHNVVAVIVNEKIFSSTSFSLWVTTSCNEMKMLIVKSRYVCRVVVLLSFWIKLYAVVVTINYRHH